MRGFVTTTDHGYVRGAQALTHSIRRWYPDTPVCIGCVNFTPKQKLSMEVFADRHDNVHLVYMKKDEKTTNTWFYKTRTLLASGFDHALFMDADSILTYTVPEVWEIIEAGFFWGSHSRVFAPRMFKDLMDDEMWAYLAKNPTKLLTSSLFGFDMAKWRDLIEKWDELCFTKKLRPKSFGDMGFLNYLLIKRQLLPEIYFSSDTKKYGALRNLKYLVEYQDGLAKINSDDSRGLIKMLHYNGVKPWELMDQRDKLASKGLWRYKSDAMSLWREIHNSIKKGNKAWTPTI